MCGGLERDFQLQGFGFTGGIFYRRKRVHNRRRLNFGQFTRCFYSETLEKFVSEKIFLTLNRRGGGVWRPHL